MPSLYCQTPEELFALFETSDDEDRDSIFEYALEREYFPLLEKLIFALPVEDEMNRRFLVKLADGKCFSLAIKLLHRGINSDNLMFQNPSGIEWAFNSNLINDPLHWGKILVSILNNRACHFLIPRILTKEIDVDKISCRSILNCYYFSDVVSHLERFIPNWVKKYPKIKVSFSSAGIWLLDRRLPFNGINILPEFMRSGDTFNFERLIVSFDLSDPDLNILFQAISNERARSFIPRLLELGIRPINHATRLYSELERRSWKEDVFEVVFDLVPPESVELSVHPNLLSHSIVCGHIKICRRLLALNLPLEHLNHALLSIFEDNSSKAHFARLVLDAGADPTYRNPTLLLQLLKLALNNPELLKLAQEILDRGCVLTPDCFLVALKSEHPEIIAWVKDRMDTTDPFFGLYSSLSPINPYPCGVIPPSRLELIPPTPDILGDIPNRSSEDGSILLRGRDGCPIEYYYAVFDGHGGTHNLYAYDYEPWIPREESRFERYNKHVVFGAIEGWEEDGCRLYPLHRYLELCLEEDPTDVPAAIVRACLCFDRTATYLDFNYGTTMTMAIRVNNTTYIANLGDSRTIVYLTSDEYPTILFETKDHEPIDELEKARIEAAGGFISNKRVDGSLAVSRSFLDVELKGNKYLSYDPVEGRVCSVPDVTPIHLPEGLDRSSVRILLTSDAPFTEKKFTSMDLVTLIETTKSATETAKVIAPTTTDDVTISWMPF